MNIITTLTLEDYIALSEELKAEINPDIRAHFEAEKEVQDLVTNTTSLKEFLKLSEEQAAKLPEEIRDRFLEEKATKETFERRQLKAFELKKEHKVKEIGVLVVGDAEGWIRKMNRKDISMAKSLGNGDEVATAELLLDAIWLEGDECIRTDDEYFFGAMAQINGMMEVKTGELVKF